LTFVFIGLTFEEIEEILEKEAKEEAMLARKMARFKGKRRPAGLPRPTLPGPQEGKSLGGLRLTET
jgi:hypothetical protein